MWRTNRTTVSAVLDEGQFEFQFLQKFELLFRHLFLLTVKVTWALRRTKTRGVRRCDEVYWLKSHSAPLHRPAELADSCAVIYCAPSSLPPSVRNAVLATHGKP